MKRLLFLLLLFPALTYCQNNVWKGAGIAYSAGAPTFDPGTRGSQVAIDTATMLWYEWNTTTETWSAAGYRIQTIAGCSEPNYTPSKQSLIVINDCDSLYYYRSGAWRHLNAGGSGGGLDWTVSGSTDSTYYLTPSAGTDQNVALVPKGVGGFMLASPDGTAAGGNARGDWAIDLQVYRDFNTEVASGNYSTISGGYNNTASGVSSTVSGGANNDATAIYSTVCGGSQNTASADYSIAIGGDKNTAAKYGSSAMGVRGNAYVVGQFAHGSALNYQASQIVMNRQITGTANTEIFPMQYTNERIILANSGSTNRAYNATVQAVAICTTQGNGTVTAGEIYTVTKACAIKLVGGTTSIVGAVQTIMAEQEDTNMAGCDIVVEADDTNDALKISFTPPTAAGTTTVIRVQVTVRLSEVGY